MVRTNFPHMAHRYFKKEVTQAEISLIAQRIDPVVIADRLAKQFPKLRTPSPSTVYHHISDMVRQGLVEAYPRMHKNGGARKASEHQVKTTPLPLGMTSEQSANTFSSPYRTEVGPRGEEKLTPIDPMLSWDEKPALTEQEEQALTISREQWMATARALALAYGPAEALWRLTVATIEGIEQAMDDGA